MGKRSRPYCSSLARCSFIVRRPVRLDIIEDICFFHMRNELIVRHCVFVHIYGECVRASGALAQKQASLQNRARPPLQVCVCVCCAHINGNNSYFSLSNGLVFHVKCVLSHTLKFKARITQTDLAVARATDHMRRFFVFVLLDFFPTYNSLAQLHMLRYTRHE